jgi:hypothetical protein
MASVPGPNLCLDNRYFKLGVRLTLFLSFHTRLQESQKPVRNQLGRAIHHEWRLFSNRSLFLLPCSIETGYKYSSGL